MKKKVMVLTIVGSFLFGSLTTYAATSNYYANLLLGQKEQIQDQLKETYNERIKQTNQMIHHDMVMYVETKRNDIINEMNEYIDQKVGSDVNNRLNEHSQYVNKAADDLVKELKEYIDSLD